MQDRNVRTCALENLSTLEEARAVLREEVDRYPGSAVQGRQQSPSPLNNGGDPSIRFAKALKEGNSLFRPFALPRPYTSSKHVFCLRERRMVNA
jgi:hypothetical protein